MKTIYFILLFIIAGLLQGQTIDKKHLNVYYRLSYQPDSTNTHRLEEDFYLNIDEETSAFLSVNKLKGDLYIAQKSQNLTEDSFASALAGVPKTRFKFLIIKKEDELNFYDEILNYQFHYKDNIPTKWKLHNDTKTLHGYTCKKAELNYSGRIWTAWYTEDIPIPEGPYKFKNLPGLIIEVSDSQDFFAFELIEIKKGHQNFVSTYYPDKILDKFKKVSKEEYFKAMRNINDNYIKEMEMTGMFLDESGKENVLKNRKKRNNALEKSK